MESALTSKGQITIPKEARERLNIASGDRVKFFFDSHGKLFILPKRPVTALYGIVRSRRSAPATLEDMEEGIAEGAVARYKRTMR